jgi:hypothetical protein
MIGKALILIVILASGETITETNIPGPIQCQRMQEAWQAKGAMAFCVHPDQLDAFSGKARKRTKL